MSMTSKQNLTEEIEFQAEQTNPRLTITDDMQPALYVGHKIDIRDRDPSNMNDHVKVNVQGPRFLFPNHDHFYSFFAQTVSGFVKQEELLKTKRIQYTSCFFLVQFNSIQFFFTLL